VELDSRVGQLRGITKLGKCAIKNLKTDEVNKLLLAPDKKGRNGCHFAAERGVRETLQKLWECAKLNINPEKIYNILLFATDNEERIIWQFVVKWEILNNYSKYGSVLNVM